MRRRVPCFRRRRCVVPIALVGPFAAAPRHVRFAAADEDVVQTFDEAALGVDFSLRGYNLGPLPEGKTRIIGRFGSAADPVDAVVFEVPAGFGISRLELLDFDGLTPAPSFDTPAPASTSNVSTPAPSTATPAPTFATPAPSIDVLAFFFLAADDAGFAPTLDDPMLDRMLGGTLVAPTDVGDILPVLANATLDFDGSTTTPDAVGTGFDIPLDGPGSFVAEFIDDFLGDFSFYAFDICIVPL